MTAGTATVEVVESTHPHALEMIRQLSSEIASIYGDDGSGAFTPADVAVPRAAFVVAYLGGEPIGCGAIRPFTDDPTTVEIKRMFVTPSARGRGISKLILRKLESLAASFGYTTLKLETGTEQKVAIVLYEQEGYKRCPCYGKYAHDPISLCYSKPVTQI